MKNIIEDIKKMGINELEMLKQKVYNSLLDLKDKEKVVAAIEKRYLAINRDDAMVEFSEVELD
jgi:hypothetical protein